LRSKTLTGELKLVEITADLRRDVAAARAEGSRIGLVPTMGALHEGHLSLVRAAREQCDFVVVTIFVNPAQFGPHEDFDAYPRRFESDLAACRDLGVDLVYHPATESVYPEQFATFVEVEGISNVLEGAFRPGHFRGVATVVLKLFNRVCPDVAYFGRKDYQQQLLIRRMCADFDLPVAIKTCPIVRDEDGLALSSRNSYLTPEQRQSALALSQSLQLAREQFAEGATDVAAVRALMQAHLHETPGVEFDYATIAHPESLVELAEPLPDMIGLVAARVGDIRLIDNMLLKF
jgi:pantoate--beta-alanine ligase